MSVNADKLVQIVPRVMDAGTPGLSFSGLVLTQSELPPSGRVLQFSSAQAVAAYFGDDSMESEMARFYFQGYVNADYLPSKIFFAAYRAQDAAAWLRGAAYEKDLAALKAVTNGSLLVSVDGVMREGSGVDLSGATSFSDVAQKLQTALAQVQEPATAGTLTGGVISEDLTALQAVTDGALDISVDGAAKSLTGLDFSGIASLADTAAVLQTALAGAALVAVNGAQTGLLVTSPTTGTSSVVGYASNPAGSEGTDLAALLALTAATGAISTPGTAAVVLPGPQVTYSSQTRAFQITSLTVGEAGAVGYAQPGVEGTDLSALLNLTESAGAVLSVGMNAQTLTSCMKTVLEYARDWVTFSTVWEPDTDAKLELARWSAGYDTRFLYHMWDTDNAAQTAGSTVSAGYQISRVLELSGTMPVFNSAALAASLMGLWACLNFDQYNGRLTAAYKQFEGLAITCDNDEKYDALIANGYNCYADFATASAQFKFLQNGQCSGNWDWADTYVNAIALKDALQLNLLDLFKAVKSIPYNVDGYAMVRTACLDTITRFLNFGAIRPGVSLSQTQKVQLLSEIGQDVSKTIETQGWYMQVKDPGATVRGQRGTPDCRFYYTDGGSIQKIVMPATVIQ